MQQHKLTDDRCQVLHDAIVFPINRKTNGLGVLDSAGNFVPDSLHIRDNFPLHAPPVPAEPEAFLKGCHLYGGILFRHFGHFLVETSSRLWPLKNEQLNIDSVLFVPKNLPKGQAPKQTFFNREWLPYLTMGQAYNELIVPTRVETLIIPSQGFGTEDFEIGSKEFHAYVKQIKWPSAPERSPHKNVYVTRSTLNFRKKGGILGAQQIGAFLEARGYYCFHPENHTIAQQLEVYKSAENLIFDDGSALHVFGMVANSNQRVAAISRRSSLEQSPVGARQLAGFWGIKLHVIDAVHKEWYPKDTGYPTSKSHAELSPRHLLLGLQDFLEEPLVDRISELNLPSSEQLEGEMRQMEYLPQERSQPLPE